MAIDRATNRTPIATGELITGEKAESADWGTMIGKLHHLYGEYGAELPGYVWPTTAPHKTSGTSYTGTNDNASRDLSTLRPAARFQRPDVSALHDIWVVFFGIDVDLKITLRRHTDGGALSTAIATAEQPNADGVHVWSTLKTTLDDNEVRAGGVSSGDYVPIDIQFQARLAAAGGGIIRAVYAYAGSIANADIP